VETQKPEPPRTGLPCPRCEGPYGEVKKIQLHPRVVTFCCRSCDYEWITDGPAPREF